MSFITINCDFFVVHNLFQLHEQSWLHNSFAKNVHVLLCIALQDVELAPNSVGQKSV